MAITMQGPWTLRVSSRNGTFPQRFVISGAATGSGVYEGTAGSAVFVNGDQWSVTLQHRSPDQAWRDSATWIEFPSIAGGILRFELHAGQAGEEDGHGLVLGCSLPVSASDHILYGTASTYADPCMFNPGRTDYLVLDPPPRLRALCRRFPELCSVVDKLYPGRRCLSPASRQSDADVRPIVLPNGLPSTANGLVFRSRLPAAPMQLPTGYGTARPLTSRVLLDRIEAEAAESLATIVSRASFEASVMPAGSSRLTRDDIDTISAVRDLGVRLGCKLDPAPGLLLRFQAYECAVSEKLGGPYTGQGPRRELGLAVVDDCGRYIFRFLASSGTNHARNDNARPDVIAQVLGPDGVARFESAPYPGVANLQRIDFSIPASAALEPLSRNGAAVVQPTTAECH
jgi:hypothetical protein